MAMQGVGLMEELSSRVEKLLLERRGMRAELDGRARWSIERDKSYVMMYCYVVELRERVCQMELKFERVRRCL